MVFSLLFAFAVARLPEDKRRILGGFFEALGDALLVIIGWVLWLAPIGVFALAFAVGAGAGGGGVRRGAPLCRADLGGRHRRDPGRLSRRRCGRRDGRRASSPGR